jgi:hypothetical protein
MSELLRNLPRNCGNCVDSGGVAAGDSRLGGGGMASASRDRRIGTGGDTPLRLSRGRSMREREGGEKVGRVRRRASDRDWGGGRVRCGVPAPRAALSYVGQLQGAC